MHLSLSSTVMDGSIGVG